MQPPECISAEIRIECTVALILCVHRLYEFGTFGQREHRTVDERNVDEHAQGRPEISSKAAVRFIRGERGSIQKVVSDNRSDHDQQKEPATHDSSGVNHSAIHQLQEEQRCHA